MGQDLRSDCEGLVALMSCFCVGLFGEERPLEGGWIPVRCKMTRGVGVPAGLMQVGSRGRRRWRAVLPGGGVTGLFGLNGEGAPAPSASCRDGGSTTAQAWPLTWAPLLCGPCGPAAQSLPGLGSKALPK